MASCEITIEFTILLENIEDVDMIQVPNWYVEGADDDPDITVIDADMTGVVLDGKDLENPWTDDGILIWEEET